MGIRAAKPNKKHYSTARRKAGRPSKQNKLLPESPEATSSGNTMASSPPELDLTVFRNTSDSKLNPGAPDIMDHRNHSMVRSMMTIPRMLAERTKDSNQRCRVNSMDRQG